MNDCCSKKDARIARLRAALLGVVREKQEEAETVLAQARDLQALGMTLSPEPIERLTKRLSSLLAVLEEP